ncbi:MAG: M23 family metallopeptidase [Sphingomonas sp.]|nr:M23 family metallopeptidase [Sphingomonas sp.]
MINFAPTMAAAKAVDGFTLVVDLAAEPLGPRWWRGAATLALLCGTALALAPGFGLLTARDAHIAPPTKQYHLNPMLTAAPEPAEPSPLILLSRLNPGEPAKPVIVSTPTAIRVQGEVSEGLYWSLRNAGVSPKLAAEYLHALASRIDVGADVAPFDRFDLIVAKAADGEQPRVLFAGLHRFEGDDVQLLKWTASGRSDWFDADAGNRRSDGLMAPVAGRMTSGFGMRHHPILRFARMHSGIDFGARYGSPIVAAADGEVLGAGWAGGYGRQVQVAHENGVVTTYSHMSGIAAERGQPVRQGQVIGYVGSTGISTGPHLHFEVRIGGRAVNPLGVKLQAAAAISGAELQAFRARLKQLLSIGQRKA